jgi:hypothetical protein
MKLPARDESGVADLNYELEIQNRLRYSPSVFGEVAEWSKAALC